MCTCAQGALGETGSVKGTDRTGQDRGVMRGSVFRKTSTIFENRECTSPVVGADGYSTNKGFAMTSLLVLHPFLLILLGWILSRRFDYPRDWWDKVERLVFTVLFPPLLFKSVATAEISIDSASRFLLCGVSSMLVAVLLAYIVSRIAPQDPPTDASVRQCGYRFNSYIGFALASSLFGPQGTALYAMLLGIWVPLSNIIAVTDLSSSCSQGRLSISAHVHKIVTNPLIVSTLAGLLFNIFRIPLPDLIGSIFSSLGSASLAMALLAIGAGMEKINLSRYGKLLCAATVQRLVAVPAVSLAAGLIGGLSMTEMGALLCLAALPTANSCYIMAVRMGGNGPVVADLTTLQTLVSLISIPLWLTVLSWLF